MDTSFSSVSTRSSSSGAPTVYDDLDTSSTPYASAGTFVNRHSGGSNRWSFFARRRSRQYPRRRCERDAQNVQRKFQKLERENRKLRIIFYLLISACFVVVFTYLCLTVVFIAAYSKQHDNSGTILSWTDSRYRQNADLQDSYCVEEKDVEDKLKKFWDKATSDTNTRYNIGGRKRRCFDFPDVKWIPRLLNSVR
ncbi:hypothetical protein BaRGS_00039843 [Batillaria attramentaria]|uniref:Uncharacterized protein n=1 Tax=Batillaria attramentaria TaxID=370345 RepID=A0ABD0J2H5_9CAEN